MKLVGKSIKKSLLTFLFVLLAISSNCFADYWSIHCENASCVASQGALKVYWIANGFDDVYHGKLTGVEGIPITIEDYQTVEKKVESVIEKSITSRKKSDVSVKVDTPKTGGPTTGIATEKENLFVNKRSMSQSKLIGKKVNINYTLAFIEWLGDTMYANDPSIRRYWGAASDALNAYKNGNIESLIERFFIARNAEKIDDTDLLNTKINDDNRELILTKYIGITRYTFFTPRDRYRAAGGFIYMLSQPQMEDVARKITEEFKADLKGLKMLMKPGQTALKLYETDKDAAYAKWLADNMRFNDDVNKLDLQDRYLIALRTVDRLKKQELGESDTKSFTEDRKEFENAIKNKDKSVKIVTVRRSFTTTVAIAGIAVVGLVIAAVIIKFRRK